MRAANRCDSPWNCQKAFCYGSVSFSPSLWNRTDDEPRSSCHLVSVETCEEPQLSDFESTRVDTCKRIWERPAPYHVQERSTFRAEDKDARRTLQWRLKASLPGGYITDLLEEAGLSMVEQRLWCGSCIFWTRQSAKLLYKMRVL